MSQLAYIQYLKLNYMPLSVTLSWCLVGYSWLFSQAVVLGAIWEAARLDRPSKRVWKKLFKGGERKTQRNPPKGKYLWEWKVRGEEWEECWSFESVEWIIWLRDIYHTKGLLAWNNSASSTLLNTHVITWILLFFSLSVLGHGFFKISLYFASGNREISAHKHSFLLSPNIVCIERIRIDIVNKSWG